MDPRITEKDHIRDYIRETRLFGDRIKVALVFTLVLVVAVIARLVYLQIFNHEHYTTLSQNNRISIVAIPPSRGLIYDRNGVLLAQNLPSFSLEIVPEQVKNLNATLAELGKIIAISDSDLKRFRRVLYQKRTTNGVPLRFHLSEEEVARFAIDRPRFPGVDVSAGLSRHYPMGSLAVHAIGYVGRINEDELPQLDTSNYSGTLHIGKAGIEKSYEDVLHGKVGFEQVETNAQGRRLRILSRTTPVSGKNLYLNIDARIQNLAEAALGERRGAVVAIDVKTGAVLALASTPGYDPNPFVNGIDAKDYAALSTSIDQPLYNRALRGLYPPGSTAKPFIGLGGLELNVVTPQHSNFCPGFFTLGGHSHRYRDWKKAGHGTVDLEKAIVESCDVYFYNLAQALGIDRLHDFMSQFGFGSRTQIDISGELGGVMPSQQWKRRSYNQPWYPGETIITGIGQGYTLVTPLQLAVATATLANGGAHMKPRVVFGTQDPLSQAITPLQPVSLNTIPVNKAANWTSVISAMTQVVHGARGTAHGISANLAYSMGGKTGTAQVFGIKQNEKYSEKNTAERLRDHALFIAFAPADQPQIAVAVIVENGSHGATTAAPIARLVMDQYFLDHPVQAQVAVTAPP
ncbi:MAG TPA: penicillin-binding protein 2 [Gammaproteobacteria bacterium]|nr:penicillin-binding protein 2 [Gammaproteobacteria bacterium]